MILGYSHVTLSSADLHQDIACLKGLGFERTFAEEGLANSPVKAPFLDTPADTMSMVYCEAPGSIAVELVSYERWADSSVGNYELLFEVPVGYPTGDLPALDGDRVWEAFLSREVVGGPVGSMGTRLSFARGRGETGGILGIKSVTDNVGRELEFWCSALGCREGTRSEAMPDDWLTATFASPFPQWRANLLFVEGGPAPHPKMDSPGSTCLSILVRDLEKSARHASNAGAVSVSDPFGIEVGGKTLEIVIVRTPGGAIVELMELQSEAAHD